MSLSTMTFHESYGDLRRDTLTLIRKHNVSPADYDRIVDALGAPTWDEVNEFILLHSSTGILRLPIYL